MSLSSWELEVADLINLLGWVIRHEQQRWLEIAVHILLPAGLNLWINRLDLKPCFRERIISSPYLISAFLLATLFVFVDYLSFDCSLAVVSSGPDPFFLIFRVRFFISDPNSLQHEQTRYITLYMCKLEICLPFLFIYFHTFFGFTGTSISCKLKRIFVRGGKHPFCTLCSSDDVILLNVIYCIMNGKVIHLLHIADWSVL